MLTTTDLNVENINEDNKTTQQKLADAYNEIADLKLKLAWLERSYE
jgi:hypothetical protein